MADRNVPHQRPDFNTPDFQDAQRDPYERLRTSLETAIARLEQYGAAPDSYTRKTELIPFGYMKDGYLATILSNDNGYLSGEVTYEAAPRTDTDRSFALYRNIAHDAWMASDGSPVTHDELATRLDADWPSELKNTNIRNEVDKEEPTLEALFGIMENELAPGGIPTTTLNIYTLRNDTFEEGKYGENTFHLASEYELGNLKEVTAQFSFLCEVGGLPSVTYCRAVSDPHGDISVKAWYIHPKSGDCIDIPFTNGMDPVVNEFEALIQQLLAEKIRTS